MIDHLLSEMFILPCMSCGPTGSSTRMFLAARHLCVQSNLLSYINIWSGDSIPVWHSLGYHDSYSLAVGAQHSAVEEQRSTEMVITEHAQQSPH